MKGIASPNSLSLRYDDAVAEKDCINLIALCLLRCIEASPVSIRRVSMRGYPSAALWDREEKADKDYILLQGNLYPLAKENIHKYYMTLIYFKLTACYCFSFDPNKSWRISASVTSYNTCQKKDCIYLGNIRMIHSDVMFTESRIIWYSQFLWYHEYPSSVFDKSFFTFQFE